MRASTAPPARPSTCSLSSRASGDADAQFRSLAEPWADTETSTGRLILAVLGGLVDVERDLIRTSIAKGCCCAKAREQHMGRPRNSARRRKPRLTAAALKVQR